jgi:hypothetical protein
MNQLNLTTTDARELILEANQAIVTLLNVSQHYLDRPTELVKREWGAKMHVVQI